METIIVSKDSKLMQMIRNAKARKIAWQQSIKGGNGRYAKETRSKPATVAVVRIVSHLMKDMFKGNKPQ